MGQTSHRLLWVAVFAAVTWWRPADLAARKSGARVHQVKRLYRQLYYDDAMKVCQAVLDAGRNPRSDLVPLLRYKGLIAAVQGQKELSVATFKKLLVIDPLAKLGSGHPPRVQRAFDAARHWFSSQRPLMVEGSAPEHTPRSGSFQVRLKVVSDPLRMVAQAVLHVRARGAKGFRTLLQPREGDKPFRWKVAVSSLEGLPFASSLEYYVAALDDNFNEIAIHGSAVAPHRAALEGPPASLPAPGPAVTAPLQQPVDPDRPPEATPWFKQWWLWTAVGVAVTVTAIGIGASVSSSRDTVDAPITLVPGRTP